ncbi:FIST C-terminal domain-containing protein [Vreelandella azerica]|uniref:FIST C-terminal domain-containing protein n=1 Tax=Vreelandella azerica TaxID=2732867 RepID=UPI001C0F7A5A|nr:FIST C-terminal domain-containing protein [Halomonas azerica]
MMNEQGELTCVGEVPEGCMVKLLNGNPNTLIAAAAHAREQAMAQHKGSTPTSADWLLIDCISRVLFLGDDMTKELEAVGQGEAVFGAFTLGEIANSGSDYLEFYNKTIVLGVLG